jgi:hypothetical protein
MQNTPELLNFTRAQGKKVEARFDAAPMSSDGGALALGEVARRTGITDKLAACIKDVRVAGMVDHSYSTMVLQRVLQICMGYEDADDCDHLRNDPVFQAAVGRAPQQAKSALASQPTMTRLENFVNCKALMRMGYAFVDHYVDSFAAEPPMVVLDMDPTAVTVYGDQQLRLFNGFEDEYCLMPFHVYDGVTGKFITTVIRPGKTPTAQEIMAVLKRIVKRLRSRWKNTQIVLRADSHHTKPEVMDWMEANKVGYITGLGPNTRLNTMFAGTIAAARKRRDRTGKEVRMYASGWYQADSWSRPRRVVCRVLVGPLGMDTRYIVTSYERADGQYLYENVYSDRGNAERMIKDHKTDLGSDRCSCTEATANQFRLFLHSAAYVIMHELRSRGLAGTQFATARFSTIRLRLLKVAARLETAKRSIRFSMPAVFPLKNVFTQAVAAFAPLRV